MKTWNHRKRIEVPLTLCSMHFRNSNWRGKYNKPKIPVASKYDSNKLVQNAAYWQQKITQDSLVKHSFQTNANKSMDPSYQWYLSVSKNKHFLQIHIPWQFTVSQVDSLFHNWQFKKGGVSRPTSLGNTNTYIPIMTILCHLSQIWNMNGKSWKYFKVYNS